jgi:DnaJ-class molecular chaperone
MSIEIDFNNLKYNLYEILNVNNNDNEKIIKKKFMTLIKIFHPDKNNKLEEDIYQHIILANQILLNKENRKKYDYYLINTADTFIELKNQFNNENKIKNNDSKSDFTTNFNKLNILHGYTEFNDIEKINNKFKKIIEIRENNNIFVPKIQLDTDIDNFNNIFDNFKKDVTNYQIIEQNNNNNIDTYIDNENYYTLINNIDKLYINDSIQTNKYTSIDRAFMLQPILKQNNNNIINKSLEERINEYNLQSETLKETLKEKFIS